MPVKMYGWHEIDFLDFGATANTIHRLAVFRVLRKVAKWEFSNGRGGARILKVERKGVGGEWTRQARHDIGTA